MKKGTVNTILLIGAAAAAWYIFTSMRKRRGSSVEAGSPIKQTESEFEAEYAQVVKPGSGVADSAKSVLDVIKSFKRTPEQKAAALAKKATKKAAKAAKRNVAGFDNIPVLY